MVSLKLILALAALVFGEVYGHGRLLDPPNRSSLWRFDNSAPANYDDNQVYCGGAGIQWNTFGGRCGVCGDKYDDPHPQNNENTGRYGQGRVVKNYSKGQVIETNVDLTTNHKGHFIFSLCVLQDPSRPEPEDCFFDLKFADGSAVYQVSAEEKSITNTLRLPDGLSCDRCVLRWEYTAGNNWGQCADGSSAQGCGPQETFRNCADISIS